MSWSIEYKGYQIYESDDFVQPWTAENQDTDHHIKAPSLDSILTLIDERAKMTFETNYKTLFKKDSNGNIRTWSIEREEFRYRTHSGVQGGKTVVSAWKSAYPTNLGKKNQRLGDEQADFEIKAIYKKKLENDYHETIEDVDKGAHFYKPMLAEKYDPSKPVAGCYAQPKLDGIRCIANKDGLFSRSGKKFTALGHIEDSLANLFEDDPDLVLDGELYNHEMKDDFPRLAGLIKRQVNDNPDVLLVQYHVYDVPSAEGVFSVRLAKLLSLDFQVAYLQKVETFKLLSQVDFDNAHGQWLVKGFEGSMLRHDAVYEQKRSKGLRKRKDFIDDEFELVSILEGEGNWSGVAKRVVCKLPDGREFGAGIKGSYERAKSLLYEEHKEVTIRFFEYTPDGIPRFGVVTAFHGEGRDV